MRRQRVFVFKARDESGKVETGSLIAKDVEQARLRLGKVYAEVLALELSDERASKFNITGARGPMVYYPDDVAGAQAEFCRRLAGMLRDGASVPEALERIDRKLAEEAHIHLLAAGQPRLCDPHSSIGGTGLRSMLDAGERAGELVQVLLWAADWIDRDAAFRRQARPALRMGLALLALGPLLALAALGYSIGLTDLLARIRSVKPESLFHSAVFILCLPWVLKQMVPFLRDHLLLRVPGFRWRLLQTDHARLYLALATFLRAGVPVLESLEAAEELSINRHLRRQVSRVTDSVFDGSSLSQALRQENCFPGEDQRAVATAESNGELPAVFAALADAAIVSKKGIARG